MQLASGKGEQGGGTKDFTIAITRSAHTIKHALECATSGYGDECGTSNVAPMWSVYGRALSLYVVGIATGTVELQIEIIVKLPS